MKGVKTSSSTNSLLPPIRQTASIFKQPVTVVKVSEENNVKTDPEHLPPVLPPTQVVRVDLAVGLEGGGACLDEPHVVDEKDCRQEERCNVHGPEEYSHLVVSVEKHKKRILFIT